MRGLALSGGGFRATLFHLGVIRYLYDLEKKSPESKALTGITHITSVSGGSVIAAHLVLNWDRYTGDEEAFKSAASELISFIKWDVRGRILRRIPGYFPFYWLSVCLRRTPFIDENNLGWWTRLSTTDILRRYYSCNLFKKKRLTHLKGKNGHTRPLLYLLTTNLDDAQQASFTSKGFNIGSDHYDCSMEDLGLAVAASSAFPGMFPSVSFQPLSGSDKPVYRLIDGGVYDNLGVRKFWDLLKNEKIDLKQVIVSDASVRFKPAPRRSFLEPITTPLRAADILFKRVYDFEKGEAEQADEANPKCEFKFLRLLDHLDEDADELALLSQYQNELYSIRTDLDQFSDLEIAALVRHGYCVACSKLGPKTTTVNDGAAMNGACSSAWDPVPMTKDRLTREMINRGSDNSDNSPNFDRILRYLNRSSIRKYRFFSLRDPMSYMHVLLLLLLATLIAGYLVFPYLVLKNADKLYLIKGKINVDSEVTNGVTLFLVNPDRKLSPLVAPEADGEFEIKLPVSQDQTNELNDLKLVVQHEDYESLYVTLMGTNTSPADYIVYHDPGKFVTDPKTSTRYFVADTITVADIHLKKKATVYRPKPNLEPISINLGRNDYDKKISGTD